MNRWIRKSKAFSAAGFAVALLLGLQLVATQLIASRMEAINILFGKAEGQIFCVSDLAQQDRPEQPAQTHRLICDICAFAAQSGVAPAVHPFIGPHVIYSFAELAFSQPPHFLARRHEPRLTRGPPSNA